MLALELKKYDVDVSEILRDTRNERLLRALSRFAELLTDCGYEVTRYSERSLRKLAEVPAERKELITDNFEMWSEWIASLETPSQTEDMEWQFLRRALDHHGLHADQEFWKTLEKDQIIEFYGPEMIQLYRSFNFFRITGYSLLDISVFEWYVLWQRPKKAIEETINDLKAVLETFVPVKKFQIPKQVIRETYGAGSVEPFVPRAIVAEFQYAGSLRAKISDGTPKGFICSSRAEVIALGTEALNIQFV